MRLTTDEVFRRFRLDPSRRDLVENCYLDEDLLAAARRFHDSEEFRALLDLSRRYSLARDLALLDLGGGPGVAALAWSLAGCSVVLAEPNRGNITGLGAFAALANGHRGGVRALSAMGESLPFPDGAFDIVYCRQVLHHTSDLDAVCREVHRVLKPAGLFLATREHVLSKPEDLPAFLESHPTHRFTQDENARLSADYSAALRRAGFRRVKVIRTWQNVINYYPVTRSGFADACRAALQKRLGGWVGRWAARSFVLDACGWYMSRRDHRPGRPYSFVAIR